MSKPQRLEWLTTNEGSTRLGRPLDGIGWRDALGITLFGKKHPRRVSDEDMSDFCDIEADVHATLAALSGATAVKKAISMLPEAAQNEVIIATARELISRGRHGLASQVMAWETHPECHVCDSSGLVNYKSGEPHPAAFVAVGGGDTERRGEPCPECGHVDREETKSVFARLRKKVAEMRHVVGRLGAAS